MEILSIILACFFICWLVGAEKFNYTRLGGEIEIEGVDDRADMEETLRTFNLLGIYKNI